MEKITERIKRYFTNENLLLIFILCIGAFFRFYNTPDRYGFDYDPTRDALIALEGARTWQFPLIGPPSGLGPFTFGPWYYYQLILFQILFPIEFSPWILIGLVSLLFIGIMYLIGRELEGKKFGLLLAIFAALSPAQTGPTSGLSNPNFVPFYAALTILFFIKLIKHSKHWGTGVIWGVLLGIGINNHYQAFGLLVLPLLFVLEKKKQSISYIIAFCVGIISTFIPLLVYNATNSWSLVKGLWFYITEGRNSSYIPNSWMLYLKDFWPGFAAYVFGIPEGLKLLFVLSLIVTTSFIFYKNKLSKIYVYLLIAFIINVIFLRYFTANREYYYYLYLHPFLFIFFGYILWKALFFQYGKYIVICFLVIVCVGMTKESVLRLATRGDQMEFKKVAQELIKIYPNNNFVLYECDKIPKNVSRGITYFLIINKRFDENGRKILLQPQLCANEEGETVPFSKSTEIVMHVSSLPHSELIKSGWTRITPNYIYSKELKHVNK